MQFYDEAAALLDAAEGQKEPFSKVVDLTREGRPTDEASHWLIETIVPRGHVTLLGGHGGSGKSMLALSWAAHVAVGHAWAGLSVCKGKVLYASLEDDGALVAVRLSKILKSGNLDCSEVIRNLTVLDGTNQDHTLAVARSTRGVRSLEPTPAMEKLTKLTRSYDLVVIDNASDAFSGNENDRAEVRVFVKGMLGRMASINKQAVLLLAHIDKAARKPLKERNLDYAHGTGHGVGYFLNVHEGPQGISKNNKVNFKEGMIVSNEPGYYENGKFGIRIENLVRVKKNKKFFSFDNLTMAPIDKSLINKKILKKKEIHWLNNYHQDVFNNLKKFMNKSELLNLKQACSKI